MSATPDRGLPGGGDAVVAHTQVVRNLYQISYPSHEPRATDPHYKAFEVYRRLHVKAAVCFVGQRVGFDQCADALGAAMLLQPGSGHGLELHHKVIEFALLNSVDLKALQVDYPFLTDSAAVLAWAESEGNCTFLCLLPGTPVLMADRSWQPIENVSVGDWVIGGDGEPDRVEAHATKPYTGDTYQIGPAVLTASHRVATSRGWRPIGEIADQLGVSGADVVRLACVQDEVGWSVVRPIAIDVMDSFSRGQRAAEYLRGNRPVLHAIDGAHVTRTGTRGGASALARPRKVIEERHAAVVGTKSLRMRPPVGTSAVVDVAPLAGERRTMGWLAAERPRRSVYSGLVHDLSVAHSHSFIAGGIVVHNCSRHHRGMGGIHHAAYADFEASLYVRSLLTSVVRA